MPGIDRSRIVGKNPEELDEFSCGICHDLFVNPVIVPCCRQTFCKDCITEWLIGHNTCPNDRQPLTSDVLSEVPRCLTNIIAGMQIKCRLSDRGCPSVHTVDHDLTHMTVCLFDKKSAANGQSTAKKKKKSEQKATVVESDDHCFRCGEGGDLIMCDRKGCPKSYHLECLQLPRIPKGKWQCPRHFCDTCGKWATALCAFCPNSFCRTHAVPSQLTQLPDGGLMCLDHSDQDSRPSAQVQ